MNSSGSCCFCPVSQVDLKKEGGLINFNLPWCAPAADLMQSPISGWFEDDLTHDIYVPNVNATFPNFINCMPCFWFATCIFICVSFITFYKISEQDNKLKIQSINKSCCFESVEFTRDLEKINIDEQKTFFGGEEIRAMFVSTTGHSGQIPQFFHLLFV